LVLLISVLKAHKINLFISEHNESVEIYSYFANGNACKGCKLIIKSNDRVILEDNLNQSGEYRYQPSLKKFEVIVDAIGGHIAKQSVEVSSIQNENIEDYKDQESQKEYLKMALGLFLIFGIFFVLKRVKQ
jgi:nickel transport protein